MSRILSTLQRHARPATPPAGPRAISSGMAPAGAAVLALGVLASGCGGLDAESRTRFTPARVVSQETENGATPMFLATPGGGRVVAWVSAPDGGSDGSLHLSVTPARARAPLSTVTVRDPLGAIEAHGEAPPQLAADSTGGISVLYAVGKEVPGERFPRSALRFVRSADSGRTWSAPVTVNDEPVRLSCN